MSIRKRVWTNKGETKEAWVHDYKDQENKRRSQQFDRKKDAEANERRVEREKHAGIHTPDSKTVTFKHVAGLWFRDCERRQKIKDRMAGGTLRNYDQALRYHILPAFGKMLLTKIDTQVAEKLMHGKAAQLSRDRLNTTIDHALSGDEVCRPESLADPQPLHRPSDQEAATGAKEEKECRHGW